MAGACSWEQTADAAAAEDTVWTAHD
jgi:hypothetical protein